MTTNIMWLLTMTIVCRLYIRTLKRWALLSYLFVQTF